MFNKSTKAALLSAVIFSAAALSSAQAADLPGKGKVIKAPQMGGLCVKPAASGPASTIPQIPAGDIFGFSYYTDTGAIGDCGVALESTTRFGKANGKYESFGLKTQFYATLGNNLYGAASFFTTQHNVNTAAVGVDRNRVELDGVSAEVIYRIVERSKTNPIAVSLSLEPRWNRIDALAGGFVTGYSNEFKAFVDAVVIPDKLYATWNVFYGLGETKVTGAGTKFTKASYINTSAALAYQVNDKFFVGAEARYLTSYTGAFLNNKAGHAVFVGPNFLYRITDNLSFNAAWTPQVSGKAKGVTGDNLDLTNFERHQVRVKLVYAF